MLCFAADCSHFGDNHVDLGPKPRSAAMMNGRRCARANASATMGDVVSLRMTLPIDMKKLFGGSEHRLSAFFDLAKNMTGYAGGCQQTKTYPKVDPDMSIYCPSVRMMPFGPAPPRNICTVPVHVIVSISRWSVPMPDCESSTSVWRVESVGGIQDLFIPKTKPMMIPTAAIAPLALATVPSCLMLGMRLTAAHQGTHLDCRTASVRTICPVSQQGALSRYERLSKVDGPTGPRCCGTGGMSVVGVYVGWACSVELSSNDRRCCCCCSETKS